MTCEGHPAFYWSHSAQLLVDTLKRKAYRKSPFRSSRNRQYGVTAEHSAQAQHILHVIQTGRLLLEPQGRTDRTLGEGHATGRLVSDFDPLAFCREQHRMVADHITGTHGREADGVALTRTCLPFPAIDRDLLQVAPQRRGHNLTHAQRGT